MTGVPALPDDQEDYHVEHFEFDADGNARISKANLIVLVGAVTQSVTLSIMSATVALQAATGDKEDLIKAMPELAAHAKSLNRLLGNIVKSIPPEANDV